jgi:hypothetical protein
MDNTVHAITLLFLAGPSFTCLLYIYIYIYIYIYLLEDSRAPEMTIKIIGHINDSGAMKWMTS